MESHFQSLQTLDGKEWSADRFAGKVTVISFTDQKSQALSTEVGKHLGKRYITNEKFQIVTAVKVPSMFKAMAGALLKGGQAKARESAVKRFEKAGQPVPEGLADRIHVVFDMNGKCSQSALSAWKDKQARVLVVDDSGASQGESCDDDAEKAVEAVVAKIDELLC